MGNQERGRLCQRTVAVQRRARDAGLLGLAQLLFLFLLFRGRVYVGAPCIRLFLFFFWFLGFFLRWVRLTRSSTSSLSGLFFIFVRLGLFGGCAVNATIDPDLAHFGLRAKISVALDDRKVRYLARFDGAKATLHTTKFGR